MEKKKEKRKMIAIFAFAFMILISIMGYTYSYFSANVREENKTETVIKTNELGLIYTGISEITANDMIPGDSFTKTFSVENTSNVAVSYNIYMESITNEFNEDLVYTISDENGVVVSETRLPGTNNEKSYLKTNINIEAKEIQNYTLKISYKYLETPQNENQGSTFSATVGIDTKQIKEELPIGGTLMATSYNSTDAFWSQRSNITKVVFEKEIKAKTDRIYKVDDVSESHNGSVLSYLVVNEENPNTYTLYIQTNGKIAANENSGDLFYGFTKLLSIEGLEYFDTSHVTNMSYMFHECSSLETLDLSHFDTSNVTNMSFMLSGLNLTNIDISGFNTINVTDMSGLFLGCINLANIDLSHLSTNSLTTMWGMFKDCKNLTNLNLSSLNTSKVENIEQLVSNCSNLRSINLNINTSSVTNMNSMFSGCSSLEALDLSSFDTSNVTLTAYMFQNCTNLTSLNLSNFNTEKVTSMKYMFSGCTNLLNLDISNFKMGNKDTSYMYVGMPSSAIIKVKNEEEQQNILKLVSLERPIEWTAENVIVVS